MFANKQDLPGAMSAEEIKTVCKTPKTVTHNNTYNNNIIISNDYCDSWAGFGFGVDQDSPLADHPMQCRHWRETVGRYQLDDNRYQFKNFYYGLAYMNHQCAPTPTYLLLHTCTVITLYAHQPCRSFALLNH